MCHFTKKKKLKKGRGKHPLVRLCRQMGVGERDRTRRKIKIGVIVSRCKMMRARPRSRTRGMRKK